MKKIPTIFKRDFTKKPHLVIDEVNPGCEWVFAGEGQATRKFDGTCCMIQAGVLYKRLELKLGRTAPPGFIPCDLDPETGGVPGWVMVTDAPEDRWHVDAMKRLSIPINTAPGVFSIPLANYDGTYELIGPKVQGDPEKDITGGNAHLLIRHGQYPVTGVPLTYDGLKEFLKTFKFEGIVWWHPDGRKAKIKRRDFSYKD